jgi:hypothetical protein
MMPATESAMPLTDEQVAAVRHAIKYHVIHLAFKLRLCARLLRAIDQGELPIDGPALEMLAEYEKEAEEFIENEADHDPDDEDIVLSRSRLAALQGTSLRARAFGGDA